MPLRPVAAGLEARILRQAEAARAEIAAFCGELIRIPTVNPPGENYRECAALLGSRLAGAGFEVVFDDPPAEVCPPGSAAWPGETSSGGCGVRSGRATGGFT